MNYGRCRSCGAQVIWIQMKSGKNMPVNPTIIMFREKGRERIVTAKGEVVSGTVVNDKNTDPEEVNYGYISHFATCPNADAHRRHR